jgi:hypothetical protein
VPSTWGNAVFGGNGAVKTAEPDTQKRAFVFPNPTKGKVYMPAGSDVSVFNVAGQLMLEKSDADSFDISHLPNGIYILQISGDALQKAEIQMIVKE